MLLNLAFGGKRCNKKIVSFSPKLGHSTEFRFENQCLCWYHFRHVSVARVVAAVLCGRSGFADIPWRASAASCNEA
jgi:hypothetical protein